MKNNKVQKMVGISLMAAMGMGLQFVAIPFPLFTFLKIDFSDLPIMVSMFLFGPLAGLLTAGLRSILHLLLTGLDPANMVGDIASFIASSVYTLPLYYFFTRDKKLKTTAKNKAAGIVSGTLLMTVVMSLANLWIITPLYLKFFNVSANNFLGMSLGKYVATGIVPFNLAKGIIVSVVFLVVYSKLLPWLSQKALRQGNSLHVK